MERFVKPTYDELESYIENLQKQCADAQATVEALQADNRTYIDERHENMKQLEELRQQMEALQREKDEAASDRDDWITSWRALQRHNERIETALDAEREKVKGLEAQCADWERKGRDLCLAHGPLLIEHHDVKKQLSQLQALVRAAVERWRAQTNVKEGISFRMAMKELEATLDATTPAPMGSNIREEDIGKSMMRRKGGDGE